jgi:putative transposase
MQFAQPRVWLKLKARRHRREKDFAWQNEYGAFSVSESNVEVLTAYISDQAEHHRKFSYQQELRELLKRHRVAFDERYLWEYCSVFGRFFRAIVR